MITGNIRGNIIKKKSSQENPEEIGLRDFYFTGAQKLCYDTDSGNMFTAECKEESIEMDNIIFIGMPASGKSTIGVVAAKRLGYEFLDTDLLIQKQEKRLLKDIIAQDGIDGFLAIEDKVNAGVNVNHTIIAPGGSVIYCENAMRHFKKIGTIVYLNASYQTISERIGDAERRGVVLREGQTLRQLYEERRALFEKYADITIYEDGLTLEETIGKVMEAFQGDGR